MEKFWTKNYPAGVPAELPRCEFRSLNEFFDNKFTTYANLPFTNNMGVTLTYAQVDGYARQFSSWLGSLGLEKGTTVALMMPNVQQYLPSLMGIVRAGFVLSTVNPMYTARELKHQLNDANAKVIVMLDNFCSTLAEVVDETPLEHIVLSKFGDLLTDPSLTNEAVMTGYVQKVITDTALPVSASRQVTSYEQTLNLGKNLPYVPVVSSWDDLVCIQYTGGTTGVSKGTLTTHGNILTAISQFYHWFVPAFNEIEQSTQINMIVALPLYHIFAFIMSLLGIQMGQKLTLVTNPRDMANFVAVLSQAPFHVFPAVNTLFQGLLSYPDFATVDCSHLKVSMAGGMASTPATAAKWLAVTGCPMIEGWGMSETLGGGTANLITNVEYTGNVGLPLPGINISIRDEAGNELSIDEVGEICIKGENIIKGYHNIANDDFFTEDGYLKTGDTGFINAKGELKLLDRKKDMLIVSGFNVYPMEIESVLSLHPMVAECGVIGIDDELQGQTVKAFIVKSHPDLTAEMLKEFCHNKLTGYKRPRHFEFIDQLPKTAVGKIQKNDLRNRS